MIGYFGLAWATMQFIFSPILGAWSDHFGRRPVILIFVFRPWHRLHPDGLSPSLRWLFLARHLWHHNLQRFHGICVRHRHDRSENRAKAFGMISALSASASSSSRRWRHPRSLRSSTRPFLGCRRTQPDQRPLRLLRFTGIAPEGASRQVRVAHGQSAWLSQICSAPIQNSAASPSSSRSTISRTSSCPFGAIYSEYRYAWNSRDVGISLGVVGVSAPLVSGTLVGRTSKNSVNVQLCLGLVYGTIGFL